MSKIVGIDLGTTNSLVATVDSGIPLVIAAAIVVVQLLADIVLSLVDPRVRLR